MNYMICLLALVITQTAAFGQTYSLTGTVSDRDHRPVEWASAVLLKNDSVLIQHTQTDSLGRFTLKGEAGVYQLVLEQYGTEPFHREIVLQQDTDLGEIVLSGPAELDEVTVTTRRKLIEQQVDRLVFYVENAPPAAGKTALDALKATPTVRVQNDQVSIVGKGDVQVMIDGRLQRMSQEDLAGFLKSIPSDQIRSIEVITTPPAQYDAEGNSGLINIRLKTARANSWNANLGASVVQKTYAGGNLQGLFNYNHNKLSLQVSANKGRQQLRTTSESHIFYADETWTQTAHSRSAAGVLGLAAGVDYKLTDRWTTGVKYLGSFTDRTSAGNPLTTRMNPETGAVNGAIASELNTGTRPEMSSLNWYHSVALDSTGKTVTIDFDYFNHRKNDRSFFSGNELNSEGQVVPGTFFSSVNSNTNRIQNYSGKIDVSLPSKRINFSYGGKVSYTHTQNDLVVYDNQTGSPVLNTDQSNVFTYGETNEALYVSAGKKAGKHWEGQVGLRMEATQTKGYSRTLDQTSTNNYVQLFPTAYITYVPGEDHSFSLNYSRRIRRPDFDYLNPFVVRTSPYFYSEGNPFLKPSFTDNLEFSYIHHQQWVSSVYYSQVTDFGQELSIIDTATNITRQTPLNYANLYQVGISTYYHFNKGSWWNSFTGFNLNYQQIRSKTDVIASVEGSNAYFYSNNDFTLNKAKTITLGVNYGWQLPGRYQIFRIASMHILDVSMTVLLLDKKLSLTVIGEDLFAQRPLISYDSNGIGNDVRNYADTRGFRVSVSYKFGNKLLKSEQRNAGNEEERDRVK